MAPALAEPLFDLLSPDADERSGERFEPQDAGARGGGLTLEQLVSRAWEGLARRETVLCPVCSGVLRPQPGAGAAPVEGRCEGCGTTLG